jgi:hypothetical protein
LLLYPGGLTAFATIWMISTLQNREPRTENREPVHHRGSQFAVLGSVALPWLGLALLPLPLAVGLPRQVDIVVTLALLEWPQVLAIRRALRAGDMRRLAAALNSYPPLILATLALAQSAGSLDIVALARSPGELISGSASVLHWIGAVALALALPPALGIGPFGDRGQEAGGRRREAGKPPTIEGEGASSQPPTPNSQPPTPRSGCNCGPWG